MDPGNWATDLDGGAHFGYRLLWVLVMSNAMAILLQTLGARLGIVTGRDLAQACRETYPRAVNLALWFLCEIAIVACDLAEVLGAAIALNLLFHIPLLIAVALTALDTLLLLWLQRLGIRYLEAFILSLILVIAVCFSIELFMAKPDAAGVFRGLVPWVNSRSLYTAIAILGATVMPHNLYLHSALVQTRNFGRSESEKRTACKWNLVDCTIALNGAMFINCSILILAAAVFFRAGKDVTEIQQAFLLLAPLMGPVVAPILFGVALVAAGQSSTLTGTLAGQIVMEGFLNIRVRPWLRRLVTRSLAIVPAFIVIWMSGNQGTFKLMLLSQVVLSLQLPFAIMPLLQFTSDRKRMGPFAQRTLAAHCGLGNGVGRFGTGPLAGVADDRGLGQRRGKLGAGNLVRIAHRVRGAPLAARVDHASSIPPSGHRPGDARARRAIARAGAWSRYGANLSPHPRPPRSLRAGPDRSWARRRHGRPQHK